jgi:uncharacterized membrane protein YwaF
VFLLESVLLVAPLGLQLTATYQFGRQTSQFIPWHFITDVIINEAITLVCRRILMVFRAIFLYRDIFKAIDEFMALRLTATDASPAMKST